ncbi:MAG TPA: hypothetical protein PK765_04185 [bacterium]|nr:hypothetical protein [bacterium]
MNSTNAIYRSKQHSALFWLRLTATFLVSGSIVLILSYTIWQSLLLTLVLAGMTFLGCYGYRRFFYDRSYFIVMPDQIRMDIRNGLFSRYDMSIHFNQVKDMAYSKNHILHYAFGSGTLFVRSSAGAEGNFIANDIPNIEQVYSLVNRLYAMSPEERRNIHNINDVDTAPTNESNEEKIERVKRELLRIQGIKEVALLSDSDRRSIFEHEEDRNHGVHECLRRDVVFVATHDATFRNADAPIVLTLGSKTIFPPVSFHEIREKNTVSSSPGIDVHTYLSKKFPHMHEYDATLLIGFNL